MKYEQRFLLEAAMNWFEEHPILTILGILLCVALFVFLQAHNEASSFRKLTGRPDVTTWDALWVELRVDCERPALGGR